MIPHRYGSDNLTMLLRFGHHFHVLLLLHRRCRIHICVRAADGTGGEAGQGPLQLYAPTRTVMVLCLHHRHKASRVFAIGGAEDEVVEELEAKQAGDGLQGGGDLQVGLAGRGVAGGMIVGDDDCIRIDLERLAEDFVRLNCRRAMEVSERDKNRLADRAAFRINR